jgi:hypothetical protein
MERSDSEQNDSTRHERFKLHSVNDLMTLPEPEWLVQNIFTDRAFVTVYGPSGDGKSFLALDWALSIATGSSWQEREVKQGAVVYVAAEGGRAIKNRVAAWMQEHGLAKVPDAFFLLEGIQVRDSEELAALITRLDEHPVKPRLIVLDTFARCFVGGEENSAKEVGEFIDGVGRLQDATGAAVLLVHHTGKGGSEMERGSSALRGAADVMVKVFKEKGIVTVSNNKQKDAPDFEDIKLRLQQIQVNLEQATTSCVLVAVTEASTRPTMQHLKPTLMALACFPGGVAKAAAWRSMAGAERTFYKHCKELEQAGFIEKLRRGEYSLTDKGAQWAKLQKM